MVTAFDPYHKWLGIGPKDQPPNHYRLLGIDAFESDADVISLAADQRMAHVRTFQTGQNAAYSQKLLNEIAAARICLLNPPKKSRYDQALRAAQPHPESEHAKMATIIVPNSSSAQFVPEIGWEGFTSDFPQSRERTRSNAVTRRKKAAKAPPTVLVIVGIGLCGVIVAAARLLTSDPEQATPVSQSRASVEPRTMAYAPPPPASVGNPGSATASRKEPKNRYPIAESSVESDVGRLPERTSDELAETPVVESPLTRTLGETPEMPAVTATPTTPEPAVKDLPPTMPDPRDRIADLAPALKYPSTPPNRAPVPDLAARERSRKQIHELLKNEIKSAKTAETKNALAAKLRSMAIDAKADPALEFVLFEEGITILVDPVIACKSIDELADRFDVDAFELKASQLERIAKESAASNAAATADCVLVVVKEAITVDRLDITSRLLAAGKFCAGKSKDRKLSNRLSEQTKEIERLRIAWDQYRAAVSTLRKNANDPATNFTVGRRLSFGKGDWERGLWFLAHGSRGVIKELAVRELADPKTAAEQVGLANDWWAAGAEEKPPNKDEIERHAIEWYHKALPSLTGIDKLRAQQRIAESAKSSKANLAKPSSFAWLSKSIADGQIVPTDFAGTGSGKEFKDVCADGGLLIGFDVTTGKFGSGYRYTSITSLTPIYLTARGEVRGRTCGQGSNGRITVVAKDGYAVGKISILADGRVQGMRITFMSVRGRALNPKDAYQSDYVGGQERSDLPILGNAKPIVGVIVNWDEHIRRLALIEPK